ncbi:DNA binding protein, translation factor [Salinarchaeum sp. Harcht-Bsk1]|uniref:L-threonylcarbamoyladenylate synthase n=1 Tax=Salinarchaeum sp. Harcht-Bsk1 TaxID=1333523 RepID=UPI0003423AD7|nr:L-threonylcarbamoyladenylate synthase [Salinarchaeum sp. Harcht-Bsk1]AGN01495.1 DNA binding protein, translation factor [Salinarchaeum sp. Harcht-Bsk1]
MTGDGATDGAPVADGDLDAAAAAIERGECVVYPTETVYGLGANAIDPDAVECVFDVKDRDRSKPVSLGVPDVDAALEFTAPTARERRFMHEFLPGPVTVVVDRKEMVPDVLTAGSNRVGVRIPDHDVALDLLERTDAPITATSANVSGTGSVRTVSELSDEVRDAVAVVLDAGETPGSESTVVDVEVGEIVRRGAMADEIEYWLEAN